MVRGVGGALTDVELSAPLPSNQLSCPTTVIRAFMDEIELLHSHGLGSQIKSALANTNRGGRDIGNGGVRVVNVVVMGKVIGSYIFCRQIDSRR